MNDRICIVSECFEPECAPSRALSAAVPYCRNHSARVRRALAEADRLREAFVRLYGEAYFSADEAALRAAIDRATNDSAPDFYGWADQLARHARNAALIEFATAKLAAIGVDPVPTR